MKKFYSNEKNVQIIIALLKAHGIKKVIASPGNTNVALIGSMQSDSFFEIFSAVDERSAAYMACGLTAESGEPVVISCTGATASRNYLPGLTEAYYRKLPVLAITSTQAVSKVGHHVAQVIDRSNKPNDVANLSITLPIVKDSDDFWDCEIKVNNALLALKRHGGGPVHINLPTVYDPLFDVKELPKVRYIQRIRYNDTFPELKGKVAVFVGAHRQWNDVETHLLDAFCAAYNAVVFCDHTSGYYGKYRVQFSLAASQQLYDVTAFRPDIFIHIGEVTGDYPLLKLAGKSVWRINEDGELRDTFRKLEYVFEMHEIDFFAHYAEKGAERSDSYYRTCQNLLKKLRAKIPEVPFSNIWIASQLAHKIPSKSAVHFGILNSLRSWNFYELPETVTGFSNTGGFGIDGSLSALLGASLFNPGKLYYCILGDLAFFYDMNTLGNRNVGNNLRILLVNNGTGTEFKNYGHHASRFGEETDQFMAASGHYGNRSPNLVKHYAQDLGFEYISAASKAEFNQIYERFLDTSLGSSVVFEVFTNSEEESTALETMMKIDVNTKGKAIGIAKDILGDKGIGVVKRIFK